MITSRRQLGGPLCGERGLTVNRAKLLIRIITGTGGRTGWSRAAGPGARQGGSGTSITASKRGQEAPASSERAATGNKAEMTELISGAFSSSFGGLLESAMKGVEQGTYL
jgi:hypothetical protein